MNCTSSLVILNLVDQGQSALVGTTPEYTTNEDVIRTREHIKTGCIMILISCKIPKDYPIQLSTPLESEAQECGHAPPQALLQLIPISRNLISSYHSFT